MTGSDRWQARSMGRTSSGWWLWLAVAVAAVELLSLVAVPAASAPRAPVGLAPAAPPSSSERAAASATVALTQAAASLAAGGGPAGGTPMQCPNDGGPGSSVTCSSQGAPAAPPTTGVALPTNPSWSSIAPSNPAARRDASLVYDTRDKYVVLFGGSSPASPGVLSDTWKYQGATWTQLHPSVSPPAREGASIAFDAADNYVVLFGGRNTTTEFDDTWQFIAGQWTELHPTAPPPRIAWASMAYDANASFTFLFGGANTSGGALGGSWEFKAGVWTRLAPTLSPTPRFGAAMAYDAHDGWVVMLGGTTTGFAGLGDTWTYTGGNWHRGTTLSPPPARAYGAAAYDPTDSAVVLFGGLNLTTDHYYSDTWEFAAGLWSKVGSPTTPSGRYWEALASGPANGTLTMFGGSAYSVGLANDTWTFEKNVWTHRLVLEPFERFWAGMAYDEADHYVVLFGGQGAYGAVFGDTWKFSGDAWSELHPSTSPSPRVGASMTYDEADGYVLLFGGYVVKGTLDIYTPVSDTWSFLHGNWSPEPATPAGPAPEAFVSLVYDAADGFVLMYGGENNTLFISSATWTYLNGAWLQTGLFPYPPSLSRPGMAYDSADGYVVLFGYNGGDGQMETWTFLGGNWTNDTSRQGTVPGDRYGQVMIDDTYDGYVVLFGGANTTTGNPTKDTWSYSGGVWTKLNPLVTPGLRTGESSAYDPALNGVILYGGANAAFTGMVGNGVWTY
jgi:hypothetical protein